MSVSVAPPVRHARQLWVVTPASVAAYEVPDRSGRIEPRVLKRRRHRYPLTQRPRDQLREVPGRT